MRLTSDHTCPICKKPRGSVYNHSKCSKELQRRANGRDERKSGTRRLDRYGKFVAGLE
jgi:hypothetical protein